MTTHTYRDKTPQDHAVARLQEQPLDVLIVGGGIVGAGVARDAAMRGLRTGLVDKSDFAAGTSSRSSRLLHGGMRYLAQARIGLVWEASREKTILARIAPHLAQPLAFIFPTRKDSDWSRWKLSLGVKLYDLLCGMRNFGRSSSLSRSETVALLPGLNEQRLTGAVRYFDALTSDARLVIDTLRSAAGHGAAVCNYTRLASAEPEDGLWCCELEDRQSGEACLVRARSLVNATGPWSDRLPHSRTSLRLTKGIHLIVDRSRLPISDAVVMTEGERILFAIPWGERVILGTTDTDYDGELDEPPCDPEDVQYILDVVNGAFSSAGLTTNDVISMWAGLRPLVADRRGRPSDVSRRHGVTMSRRGWWDVTGGKLTTYRLMAEETVDAIVKYLGVAAGKCQTAKVPLLADDEVARTSVRPGRTRRTKVRATDEAHLVSGILPPPVSASVVEHFCRVEWARSLDDVMIRRTSWRHYHRDHLDIAARVARWMAAELGWDQSQVRAELARYRELVGAVEVPAPHIAGPDGLACCEVGSALHARGKEGSSQKR